MIDTLSLIIYVYAAVYLAFACMLVVGIRRLRPVPIPEEPPFVSVVVCARNEEADIGRCLESLAALEYPRDRLEILVVDDESEDGTGAVIREFAERHSHFRALSTVGLPRKLPAKQRPMHHGITSARGDIILATDADCAVRPGWVNSHVCAYDDTVGMTGGVTLISTDSGSLFDWLQNSDLATKLGVVMGCSGIGIPLTVMGNNISFRKNVYEDLGGFERIAPSIVEDMALMNAIKNRAGMKISWARGKDGVAVSTPEETLSDLVEQRRRWVHEIGDFSAIGKTMLSVEVVMAVMTGMAVVLAFAGSAMPLAAAVTAWLCGIGMIMLAMPGTKTSDLLSIPPMFAFQLFYGALLLRRTVFGSKEVVWKGRDYSGRQ